MALTLNTIRNGIQTSVYGRRLGLTLANDLLIGFNGVKEPIEDINTTVPTTVAAFGVTRNFTSGSSQGPTQHFLPVPIPGVEKTIMLNSTSTGSQQYLSTANGAAIIPATLGTTVGVLNFIGPAGSITLLAITSTLWAVKAMTGAFTFSTST